MNAFMNPKDLDRKEPMHAEEMENSSESSENHRQSNPFPMSFLMIRAGKPVLWRDRNGAQALSGRHGP